MRNKVVDTRESGMALVFAIGLLALMLAVGLAFVGNALIFRKVALNNSSRTQSRMLALSAANRAAAAVMMYQQQFAAVSAADDFPANFDMIYSYGKYDPETGDSTAAASGKSFSDALLDQSKSESVMRLPEDNSVIAKSFAEWYNTRFKDGNWPGKWVFFHDKTGSGRKIVGRAAWQVVTSSAQILAPVFFRGHLADGSELEPDTAFVPNNARWGRDIDEVFFRDSGTIFADVPTNVDKDDKIVTVDQIVTSVSPSVTPSQKQWLMKWLFADPDENATVRNPTLGLFPETYLYEKSGGKKKYQLMRFNISELTDEVDGKKWYTNYGVTASADPWYARFGIDSSNADKINNAEAIRILTLDSTGYANGYDYDFEITPASDRSGLPFLRRIGDSSENATTFVAGVSEAADGAATITRDIAAWRRQIAANFNDYCDADSIPTSDVGADKWSNDITASYEHPKYTGNEKTPYLYELGFKAGLDKDTSQNVGVAGTITKGSGNDVTMKFAAQLRIAPMLKLANLYDFKGDGFSAYDGSAFMRALVDFGSVYLWYKLQTVAIKNIVLEYTDENGDLQTLNVDVVLTVNRPATGESEANVAGLKNLVLRTGCEAGKLQDSSAGVSGVAFPDSGLKNETGGNPYPVNTDGAWQDTGGNAETALYQVSDLENKIAAGEISMTLDRALLTTPGVKVHNHGTTAAATIPEQNLTLKSVGDLEVHRVLVTGLSFQPRRMVLMAANSTSGKFGVDYVRPFFKPLVWNAASENDFIELTYESRGSGTEYNGVVTGGLRNFDPRQNLNAEDWYGFDPDVSSNWYPGKQTGKGGLLKVVGAVSFTAPTNSELTAVMDVNTSTSGKENTGDANFIPGSGNSAANKDDEGSLTGPAYDGTNRISTAFIRNAPMMSPWEIGAVHRGVRWQTINLKVAGNIGGTGGDFKSTSFEPNGDGSSENDWKRDGTAYQHGDGAILDQIKMTDRLASYGKINVNLLNTAHSEYDAANDKYIAYALFDNLSYGQSLGDFVTQSTRDGSSRKFPGGSSGTPLNAFLDPAVNNMVSSTGRPSGGFLSRAGYLNFDNGGLGDAFGAVSGQNTDAAQEEIIGKTINLLTAGTTSPAVVQVVVVAQSIRDLGGMQVKMTSETDKTKFTDPNGGTVPEIEDGTVALDCSEGRFDMLEHADDSEKNVYFDEITGEVKMLVTMDRDPLTGKLKIRQIDYL